MKLSIFLAGIRTSGWNALYESVSRSTALDDYELIIVSPYDLPPQLQGKSHVRLVKDAGCPTRCYQLGLLASKGEYIVWAGDDGTFSSTMAIDKGLESIPKHKKGVVAFKYSEGHVEQKGDAWWRLGYHPMLKCRKYVPNHYFLVMSGMMHREYLLELGGWDCKFEHSALSCVDLSIRMQRDGAEVILGEKIQDLALQRGSRGDHGPIKQAHQHDKGVFGAIYTGAESLGRIKIDVNNWKKAQDVWDRRWPGGIVT